MEEFDILKKFRGRSSSDEIVVNEFNEDSAQEFRDSVQEAAKDDPMKPIVIYIDSYGGQVDALAKMIETMDEISNPFITVVIGKAMSCGAVLLSHGDIRFCGKHSRIMIHEVSGGTAGDVHDMDADAQEVKRLNKYFINLLAKNCSIAGGYDALRKSIKDQDGRDKYLNAEQAQKFGIVDAVGIPRVNKVNVYQVELIPEKQKHIRPKARGNKKSETKKRR